MFGLIRGILSLLVFATTLAIVALVALGVLAFAGTPKPCVDRSPNPTIGGAASLTAEWLQILDGPSTVTVTEEQATSIASSYLDANDVPIKDVQIRFCPDGTAEASGKVGVKGFRANVIARGTLDVSAGSEPRIHIEEVDAGRLPGSAAKSVVDAILKQANIDTINVPGHLQSIQYRDGAADVTGGP